MKSQLLFLYIHKYRNILEQGFCFSSEFKIALDNFSQQEDDTKLSLVISPTEYNIPGLFHDCFTDVKGIIGENGAGKSTLLQFLAFQAHEHQEFVEYNKDKIFKDVIVYAVQDDDGQTSIRIGIGKSWGDTDTINCDTFSSYGNVQKFNINEVFWEELPGFSQEVIYYSNVADFKWEASYNGLVNISTNFLARQDQEEYTNRIRKGAEKQLPQLTAHLFQDDGRRIRFALKFKPALPFEIQGYLNVFFTTSIQSELKEIRENLTTSEQKNALILMSLIDRWQQASKPATDTRPALRYLFHKQYLDYFIVSYLVENNDTVDSYFTKYPEYRIKVFEKLIELFEPEIGMNKFEEYLAFVKEEEAIVNADQPQVGLGDAELSRRLPSFITLDKLLESVYENEVYYSNGFMLPLDNNAVDIHEEYKRTVYMKEYLNFMFPGLSSGELGFLTLFSRFYELVDTTAFSTQQLSKNKLLILIDEGDLYFHPKWQVLFMNYINEIFSIIFVNKEIQLLITTHSPFIASDLPKDNLLFLRKGTKDDILPFSNGSAEGKTLGQAGPQFTFGSNVHELLSDSFFLQGAHIGQLAKKTIYDLVDFFETGSGARSYTKEEAVNIISQIGEPWVRSRLFEKLDVYFLNRN